MDRSVMMPIEKTFFEIQTFEVMVFHADKTINRAHLLLFQRFIDDNHHIGSHMFCAGCLLHRKAKLLTYSIRNSNETDTHKETANTAANTSQIDHTFIFTVSKMKENGIIQRCKS